MIPAHHVPVPQAPTGHSSTSSNIAKETAGDGVAGPSYRPAQTPVSPSGRLRDLHLDDDDIAASRREVGGSVPLLDAGTGADVEMSSGAIQDDSGKTLFYRSFRNEEEDLEGMMKLIEAELSEPPHLTLLVFPSPHDPTPIATIVCKQDIHRGKTNRGYIAMLSVDKAWRRRGVASNLVQKVIEIMKAGGVQEIVLETEVDNASSLALYDHLGFLREKRLHRFYTNAKDALGIAHARFRLILPLENHPLAIESDDEAEEARHAVGAGPADWDAFIEGWDSLQGTREGELLKIIAEEEAEARASGASADRGSREDKPPPPPVPPRQAGWDGMYT